MIPERIRLIKIKISLDILYLVDKLPIPTRGLMRESWI